MRLIRRMARNIWLAAVPCLCAAAWAAPVDWVGNTFTYPGEGGIGADDTLWINTETHPKTAATNVSVLFTANRGLTWQWAPMTTNGASSSNCFWHADLGCWPAGTRVEYVVRAQGGGAELWDNNGALNHIANVEPLITDVYKDKAVYNPGATATIIVEVANSLNGALAGELRVRLYRLNDSEAAWTTAVALASGASTQAVFKWNVGADDFRGYGIDADWVTNGVTVARRSHALDVSSDWRKFPRYGFYTDFWPGQTAEEAAARALTLSKYHINIIQYYDWMYTHDHLLLTNQAGEAAAYYVSAWPASAMMSTRVIRDKIAASAARNMVNMAYSLIYGDSGNAGCPERIEWAAFTSSYQTACGAVAGHPPTAQQIFVMDASNEGWQSHIFNEFRRAVELMGFDGIHLDNLGGAWRYKYNSNDGIPEWVAFPSFINDCKTEIQSARPGRELFVTHNDVAGNYRDSICAASADCYYQEVWGRDSYWDLGDIIRGAKAASGNTKQVVLAAYINRYDPPPQWISEASVKLADAAIFANGGFHLELGEGVEMLVNEYFPLHTPGMSATLKRAMRDYYDFLVKYENLLSYNALGNVADGTDAANIWSGTHNLTKTAATGAIWTVSRLWRDEYDTLNLINLYGVDWAWRNQSGNPTIQTDILLKYYSDKKIQHLYWATPDDGLGRLQELAFSEGVDGPGYYVMFTVPRLDFWDLVLFDKRTRIKVDDWPYDWTGTPPAQVHDVAISRGEWIYKGEAGDHRTWLGAASDEDLTEARVTCDDDYVFFRFRFADVTNAALPAVGIAWDVDQNPADTGYSWIGDSSRPSGSIGLANAVQYAERQIMIYTAGGAAKIRLWDGGSWYEPPSRDSAAYVSRTYDMIEARVRKTDLGISSYPQRVAISLASFRSSGAEAGSDATYNCPDANNDAVDVMGGDAGISANAWARDLADNNIGRFHQFTLNRFGVERRTMDGRGEEWNGYMGTEPYSSTVSDQEYVFRDAAGDDRAAGDGYRDLEEFRVIGDAATNGNLYFYVRLNDFVSAVTDSNAAPLIQIALDYDRTDVSDYFQGTGDPTNDTQMAAAFRWDSLVQISGLRRRPEYFTGDWIENDAPDPACNYGESESENFVEARIPYAAIGGSDQYLGHTVRFTVISSRDNPANPGDPAPFVVGTPHAVDGISTRNDTASFYTNENLAADRRVDYAFAVHFGLDGSASNQLPTAPATPVPVNGGNVFSNPPALAWAPASDFETNDGLYEYRIELSRRPDMSAAFWDRNTASTNTAYVLPPAVGLTNGETVYWRVWSRDLTGALNLSPTWSFQWLAVTASAPPAAAADLAVDRATGALVAEAMPTFRWVFSDADSPGQGACQIQVSTNATFIPGFFDSGLVGTPATSYPATGWCALAPDTLYYWRVRTWDSGYTAGPWSATQSFRTLRKFIDGARDDWSGAAGAETNSAVVDAGEWIWSDNPGDERGDSDFDSAMDLTELRFCADELFLYVLAGYRDLPATPNPPVAMLGLAVDTDLDPADTAENWLGDESGVALNAPGANVIRAERIVDLSASGVFVYHPPTFTWSNSPDAAVRVDVTNDLMEARIPLESLGITSATGFTIRVTAATFQRQGDDPNTGDHTLDFYNPDAMDTLHPSLENAWGDLADSDLDFFCDVSFASNGLVISNTVAAAPVLQNPTNGQAVATLTPTLDWSPVSPESGDAIAFYHVQVSTSAVMMPLLFGMDALSLQAGGQSPVPTNFTVPASLVNGWTYYWRARAYDTHGAAGAWSDVRAFTVRAPAKQIDGIPADWLGAAPGSDHATAINAGEWIYRGKEYDNRWWGNGAANSDQDITEVRFSADSDYVYFLVRFFNLRSADAAAVGIAWDVDHDPEDTGYNWIGDDSMYGGAIGLANAVQYAEREIMFYWSGGAQIRLWDGGSWYAPPSGDWQIAFNTNTDCIEARINRADLLVASNVMVNASLVSFVNSGFHAGQDATFDSDYGNDGVDVMGGNIGVWWEDAWTRDLADGKVGRYYTFWITDYGVQPSASLVGRPYAAEEGATQTIGLWLDGAAAAPATIQYATVNGTATGGLDFVAATGTITWAAGESGYKSFGISVMADAEVEGPETFQVYFFNLTNCTIDGATSAVAAVTISPIAVLWAGYCWHWPFDGDIDRTDDFWVNVETWPKLAAMEVYVRYTLDGTNWLDRLTETSGSGIDPNNDWWHLNLGSLPAGTTIEYTFYARDGLSNTVWSSNRIATVNGTLGDGDADGMNDDWEARNGLNVWTNDAALDPDGDRFSNLQEYIAGTSPTNAASVHEIWLDIPFTNRLPQISCLTQVGRLYRLLYNDDMRADAWTNLPPQAEFSGNGNVQTLSDTNSLPSHRYYRVGVRLP